jgi:hypothetical protein
LTDKLSCSFLTACKDTKIPATSKEIAGKHEKSERYTVNKIRKRHGTTSCPCPLPLKVTVFLLAACVFFISLADYADYAEAIFILRNQGIKEIILNS